MTGDICEDFFLNLKWEDTPLIQILGVGRYSFNTYFLKWEDLPLIGATPSVCSLYKGPAGKEEALALCLFALSLLLASPSLHCSRACIFGVLVSTEVQPRHPAYSPNNYWSPDLPSGACHCWNSQNTTCKPKLYILYNYINYIWHTQIIYGIYKLCIYMDYINDICFPIGSVSLENPD